MKLFITGISGLLGLNLALQTRERFSVSGAYYSHPVSLAGVQSLAGDLRSFPAAQAVLGGIQPDVIVHTVGLTNVEECEANPALAYQLNVDAARHVATMATTLGARMVHVSTDHLFDGKMPWSKETDVPAPLNIYARTKWLAEQEVLKACPGALIIRTNFFGWGTSFRASFSDWVLKSLKHGSQLTMFSDVFFTPILINHLVDLIIRLIESETAGVLHVAGGERLTKYDFALKLAQVFGLPTESIRPISIEDFAFNAQRPKDMSLSTTKVESRLKVRMPTVAEGLEGLRILQLEGWPQALEKAALSHTLSG